MEQLKSNAEIKAEAARWVLDAATTLESDKSRKLIIVSGFLEPWTLAVTISEAISRQLRWREVAPNPSPRLRCLQFAHHQNLLEWPSADPAMIRVRPDNLFDPPPRAQMIESVSPHLGNEASVGDVVKIEGGWAVAAIRIDDLPEKIPGFTLRRLTDDEISELPPATQTGLKTVSVSSPRIDAVSAKVLKPSREQIKKHIDSGGVLLNHEPAKKPGIELSPDDVVAVRGGGRFRFIETDTMTKKGRFKVIVEVLSGP